MASGKYANPVYPGLGWLIGQERQRRLKADRPAGRGDFYDLARKAVGRHFPPAASAEQTYRLLRAYRSSGLPLAEHALEDDEELRRLREAEAAARRRPDRLPRLGRAAGRLPRAGRGSPPREWPGPPRRSTRWRPSCPRRSRPTPTPSPPT